MMYFKINDGWKIVAHFGDFKSAALLYSILKEYAKWNEPVHYAGLSLEGQKILGCYYPRRTMRNPDRGKWRASWEDANGRAISAAEAKAKLAACQVLI
jgi:hypothetical protein